MLKKLSPSTDVNRGQNIHLLLSRYLEVFRHRLNEIVLYIWFIQKKTLSLKLVVIVYLSQINKWLPVLNNKRVVLSWIKQLTETVYISVHEILHRPIINSMWKGDSIFALGITSINGNFTSVRSVRHKLNMPFICNNQPISYFIKKMFKKTSVSCFKPRMKL